MADSKEMFTLVAKRKPLHHEAVPFVVCWAQKAGCTTILKWFLFHAGLLDDAVQYGVNGPGRVNAIHKFENEVFKSRKGYTEELVEKLRRNCHVINFVRCPFERAFSSYVHIHNPIYVAYPNWQLSGVHVRKKILRDIYGDTVCIDYPISFQDYLTWLSSQNLETLDPHHRPQYTPLFDAVTVEHFRLDDLTSVAAFLEDRYGLTSSRSADTALLFSEHHLKKQDMSKQAILKFLGRGMPVARSATFQLPKVTRDVLVGTNMGSIIENLFARDIQLYDRI